MQASSGGSSKGSLGPGTRAGLLLASSVKTRRLRYLAYANQVRPVFRVQISNKNNKTLALNCPISWPYWIERRFASYNMCLPGHTWMQCVPGQSHLHLRLNLSSLLACAE